MSKQSKLAAFLGASLALSDYGQYNEEIKTIMDGAFDYRSKSSSSKLPLSKKQKKARAAAKRAKKARRINR